MDGLLAEAAVYPYHMKFQTQCAGENIYNQTVCGGSHNVVMSCGASASTSAAAVGSLADKIAATKKKLNDNLGGKGGGGGGGGAGASTTKEVDALRKEMSEMRIEMDSMKQMISEMQEKLRSVKITTGDMKLSETKKPAPKKEESDEDDEDIELFGSDDEPDEEKERIKQQRLEAYAAKKSKKPALIAKSSVVFDVKPWDDETDMAEMEKNVRMIEKDGLVWGAAKLVPLAYGIKKLQIMCVVEDEKVSVEELSEQMAEDNEDLIQSVDIAAFNKI